MGTRTCVFSGLLAVLFGLPPVVAIGDHHGIDLLLFVQVLPLRQGLRRRHVRGMAFVKPDVHIERNGAIARTL